MGSILYRTLLPWTGPRACCSPCWAKKPHWLLNISLCPNLFFCLSQQQVSNVTKTQSWKTCAGSMLNTLLKKCLRETENGKILGPATVICLVSLSVTVTGCTEVIFLSEPSDAMWKLWICLLVTIILMYQVRQHAPRCLKLVSKVK